MGITFTPEFLERFRIIGLLAEGGMAGVYQAVQQPLERMVAVKFMLGGFSTSEGRLRFLSEAKLAARIQHPNTVSVYEFGEMAEIPYIVLECVNGQTLRRLLEDHGPDGLPIELALD